MFLFLVGDGECDFVFFNLVFVELFEFVVVLCIFVVCFGFGGMLLVMLLVCGCWGELFDFYWEVLMV